MENQVIVATFDNQDAAFGAAQDAQDLERSGVIKIKRGAILTKDANGTLTAPDVKYVGSSWGLIGGGVIGALLGSLFGPAGAAGAAGALGGAAAGLTVGSAGDALSDAVSEDRDDQLLHDVISGIEPGQTVLVAELDAESTESVDSVVTRRGGRVFRTSREVSKVEQVQQRVERILAGEAARIEDKIAADEAERDRLHDDLKESDIEMLGLLTVNQQSKYDEYANSEGPTSTRPFEEL